MKKIISYTRWKERLLRNTPVDHRIGDDLLLIERSDTNSEMITYEPFRTDLLFAIIFETGKARMKINMREHSIVAPCILIIMADQIYEPVAWTDTSVRIIAMSKDFINGLAPELRRTHSLHSALYNNPIIVEDSIDNAFNRYFDMLLNIAQSTHIDYKTQAARHLTLSMFYAYTYNRHTDSKQTSDNSRQEEIYLKFIDLVRQYHKKERIVSFYANKLCLSPKYLYRVILCVSGHSLSYHIDEYVITEAKAMLNSTLMTVQQISDELNFSSQSSFGKFFSRVTGISPRKYRKMCRIESM